MPRQMTVLDEDGRNRRMHARRGLAIYFAVLLPASAILERWPTRRRAIELDSVPAST
jgi:hypothetical protein